MNGKWLLILMLSINLLSIMFANISPTYGQYVINNQNSFINNWFILGSNFDSVPQYNSSFQSTVDSTLNANEQTVSSASTLGGFIDGIRLVIGFMSLLTPAPMLTMFATLQLPVWFTVMIGIPLTLLWLIAFIEFFRGGQF